MIDKDTIKCESVFNEERTHRYLWKRVWNKDKPIVAVIMLNPCLSDNLVTDTSTFLCCNNVTRLEEYGGIAILNLYSLLTNKLNFRWNSDEDLNNPENNGYIQKTAAECGAVILAWGRASDNMQRVADRANEVLELLKPYADKLFVISDGERSGLHPLTPSIRNQWFLESFHYAEPSQEKSEEQAEQ